MQEAARELQALDWIAPVLAAVVFVCGMSLLREPARRHLNAILVAGAGAAYLNGGLGAWEFAFLLPATALAYRGLRSHRAIGAAWLLHAGWDVVHHFYGDPIWYFQPTSSAGCALFDTAIAVWFLADAPTLIPRRPRPRPGVQQG